MSVPPWTPEACQLSDGRWQAVLHVGAPATTEEYAHEIAVYFARHCDRRLKDLSPAARKLLALLTLTRRPHWKVGHLLTTLAALPPAWLYAA